MAILDDYKQFSTAESQVQVNFKSIAEFWSTKKLQPLPSQCSRTIWSKEIKENESTKSNYEKILKSNSGLGFCDFEKIVESKTCLKIAIDGSDGIENAIFEDILKWVERVALNSIGSGLQNFELWQFSDISQNEISIKNAKNWEFLIEKVQTSQNLTRIKCFQIRKVRKIGAGTKIEALFAATEKRNFCKLETLVIVTDGYFQVTFLILIGR